MENGNPELNSLWVASLRCLKLVRIKQVSRYFDTSDIYNRRQNNSWLRTLQAIYYLFLATHLIGCIWLIVARIDPDKDDNWETLAGFPGSTVSEFERYVDSTFYVVATMTGLGYGNIVPVTNLEYFIDMFIMVTGASIYANFFANFRCCHS